MSDPPIAVDDLITVAQAARETGFSIAWIRALAVAGKIAGVRVAPRLWLVSRADVSALERTTRGRPKKGQSSVHERAGLPGAH